MSVKLSVSTHSVPTHIDPNTHTQKIPSIPPILNAPQLTAATCCPAFSWLIFHQSVYLHRSQVTLPRSIQKVVDLCKQRLLSCFNVFIILLSHKAPLSAPVSDSALINSASVSIKLCRDSAVTHWNLLWWNIAVVTAIVVYYHGNRHHFPEWSTERKWGNLDFLWFSAELHSRHVTSWFLVVLPLDDAWQMMVCQMFKPSSQALRVLQFTHKRIWGGTLMKWHL